MVSEAYQDTALSRSQTSCAYCYVEGYELMLSTAMPRGEVWMPKGCPVGCSHLGISERYPPPESPFLLIWCVLEAYS